MEQMRTPADDRIVASILRAVADFWWVQLPTAAGRLWPPAAGLLSDGLALGAWRLAAVLAPPVSFLVGFLVGWLYLKSGALYTSSILALGLMLAVSYTGLACGIWVWLGYVVADTFLITHPLAGYPWFERLLLVRGGLLVSYLLLAGLLIGLPLAARALSRLAVTGLRPAGRARQTILFILQPSLLGAMVYSWVQAVPVLIEPVYTWRNSSPPADATASLHDRGWILPLLAIVICAARQLEIRWAVRQPEIKRRLGQLKQAAARPRRLSRIPDWLSASMRAGLITLMLSGLFADWLEAIVWLLFVTALAIAQSDWFGKLRIWNVAVSYVPVIIRLLLALGIGAGFGKLIFAHTQGQQTYRPMLMCLAVTMTAVALLIPKPSLASRQLKVAA